MQVFLSYSRADESLAQQIAETLRSSGFKVWEDSQILPGGDWAVQVSEALNDSEAMVVLLTPDGLKANSVHHNISFALGHQAYRERLISVLANSPNMSKVPWSALQFGKTVDLDKFGNVQQIVEELKKAA
jgi:hypothetical protein